MPLSLVTPVVSLALSHPCRVSLAPAELRWATCSPSPTLPVSPPQPPGGNFSFQTSSHVTSPALVAHVYLYVCKREEGTSGSSGLTGWWFSFVKGFFFFFPCVRFLQGSEREERVTSTLDIGNRVLLRFKKQKSSNNVLLVLHFFFFFFQTRKHFIWSFSVFFDAH